jgi:hypothetical protein
MESNTPVLETVIAWADIVEKIWLDKITKLGISSTYMLEESFRHEVLSNAGNPTQVSFAFRFYGRFVDMGVGKGVPLSEVKEQAISRRLEGKNAFNSRRPKPWYGKTFHAERLKLAEILAKKYARKAALTIVENMDDNALSWNSVPLNS